MSDVAHGPLVSSPDQLNDIIMCLLICTGFSGERCGPWASCLTVVFSLAHLTCMYILLQFFFQDCNACKRDRKCVK